MRGRPSSCATPGCGRRGVSRAGASPPNPRCTSLELRGVSGMARRDGSGVTGDTRRSRAQVNFSVRRTQTLIPQEARYSGTTESDYSQVGACSIIEGTSN